jgi:branched-chain amino acid transport system permease protein
MALLLVQALNGLQLGVLLFLVAAGLTLVFGVLDVINLAHGVQYMLGAYAAASVWQITGSFALAVLAATLACLVIGLLLEWVVFRNLRGGGHLEQVLATFGLILLAEETIRALWGPAPLALPVPDALSGTVALLGLRYPAYRLVLLGAGLAVAALLWLVIERTRAGMLVRAGATNAAMLSALGVDIGLVFAMVLGAGAALAGFAGAMAAPLVSIEPGMGGAVLIPAFVVIVVGGAGSIRGAFLGAILVGLLETMGRQLLGDGLHLVLSASAARQAGPALASMLTYVMMAIVLAIAPGGLLPARGAARA